MPLWDLSCLNIVVYSGQQLRSLRHFQVPLGIFCGFLRADRRIDLAFDTSSDMLPRVTFTAVGLEGLQQGSEGNRDPDHPFTPPYPRVESLTIPVLVVRYHV